MGCDIHLFVEAKGGKRDDWSLVKRTIHVATDYQEERVFRVGWGEGRNYDVFAMLANVRNGRGFAGIDLGDGFTPIDTPRGIPSDTSIDYLDETESYGMDGHSHSYFSLRELLDLEPKGYWDNSTTHRGVLLRDEFEQLQAQGRVESLEGNTAWLNGRPDSWAGDISGPAPKDIFQVNWVESYRRSAGWLLNTTLPQLTELADSYELRSYFHEGAQLTNGPGRPWLTLIPAGKDALDFERPVIDLGERVRIVFFFDN